MLETGEGKGEGEAEVHNEVRKVASEKATGLLRSAASIPHNPTHPSPYTKTKTLMLR